MADRVERLPPPRRRRPPRVRGSRDGARPGRSPAPCPGPGRSGGGPGTIPRGGRLIPRSRLPIGSKVGWASVSPGSENASVSRTRGVQRLRARPMKSTREVRNPSGITSAARMPSAFECLSQARTAWSPLDVLHLGEQAVVLRVAPVGVGPVEDPFQVGHDLDPPRRVRPGSRRVIVQSSTGSAAPGRLISTVVRRPAAGADDQQASGRPARNRERLGALGRDSCRPPARTARRRADPCRHRPGRAPGRTGSIRSYERRLTS